MPTQASSSSRSSSKAGVFKSGLAFYSASAASHQLQQRPGDNQEDEQNNSNSRISKHEQSFEKQKELVAAATAKAFANRSSGSSGINNGGGSHFLSTSQFASMSVDGINPYVEQQHSGDEEDDDEYDEYEEYDDEQDGSNQNLEEWENPSYLVKNLDTGESYNVEEIDQHYNLVTLDAVAAQHESKYV